MNATKSTKSTNNGATTMSEADRLLQKERDVRRKYPRAIKGTLRKETKGSHAGKFTVEIKCAQRNCSTIRRVATSDLFQVSCCLDCTRQLRNAARRAARKVSENGSSAIKTAKPAKAKPAKAKPAPKMPDEGTLPPQKHTRLRIRKVLTDAGTLQSGPVGETVPALPPPAQDVRAVSPEPVAN
jgi:hypothetical protein